MYTQEGIICVGGEEKGEGGQGLILKYIPTYTYWHVCNNIITLQL